MQSDWLLPFELMCDISDHVIGAILGQRKDKKLPIIYYAGKTLTKTLAFDKFCSYLIRLKIIVYIGNFTLKFLIARKKAKLRLIR